MQDKEKTTLNDFEDLGPDTDFAEFEAQENELNDGPEKSDAEAVEKAPKKSTKKKSAQKDEGEASEVVTGDVDDADAESKEEMKELFVRRPTDCTADSFTISINLKSYEIKYGEPNLVPKHVYDYYYTMEKQKDKHEQSMQALRG